MSGNSAPSLPFSISAFVDFPFVATPPVPLPLSPSPSPSRPVAIIQPRDTPLVRDIQSHGSNPQLSSPISPPRSLKPLTGSQGSFPVSSKRLRVDGDADATPINSQDVLDTPRRQGPIKAGDEPITPKSVKRRTLSQQQSQQGVGGESSSRLPTLTELIASSKKGSRRGTPGQKSMTSSQTPRRGALGLPEMSSSQIPFSMFMPQAESTQACGLFFAPSDIEDAP